MQVKYLVCKFNDGNLKIKSHLLTFCHFLCPPHVIYLQELLHTGDMDWRDLVYCDQKSSGSSGII